jgi:DMSO/TMAO reductase YedYZ molybdopterin-dependent catalytic subunit
MTTALPAPAAARAHPTARPTWTGALTGTIAAGVGLAAGELFAGLSDTVPSLVIAVGELVIDYTPGDLVETGIETAGTADKPLLLAGIVVFALLFGTQLGIVGMRRPRVADVGFLAFGALGGWAAARNPFSAAGWSWIAAITAALLAIATRRVLLAVATLPAETLPNTARADDPFPSRRAFLAVGAGVSVAALGAAMFGRALRNARGVEGARADVVLPPPQSTEAVVAAPDQLDTSIRGLSSYITPNDDFYRIDTALQVPQVDPAEWKLRITGLVDEPFELTYDEILAMDLVETTVTLSCVSNEVGGSLVGNATWLGVPLTTLLDRAGVQPAGTQIVGVSVDDFDAGFPTELAYDGRTALLAVGMNGEPLPIDHGFPARLVVAGLYGYVSAVKWISEIRLDTSDHDAYWIPRGWSKLGPVKTQSRIDVPRRSADLVAGPTPIAGVAWAPSVGIERVEVQIDEGAWLDCTLGEATSDDTWVQWVLEWDATPGRHEIAVRATDKTGAVQSMERRSPAPDGAEGYHRIRVDVT